MDVKTFVAAYFLFFNFLKKKTLDVMKTLTKLKVFIFLRFVVKNKVSKPWLTRCALVANLSSQPEPLYLACEATQVNTFPLREQTNHFSNSSTSSWRRKDFFVVWCRLHSKWLRQIWNMRVNPFIPMLLNNKYLLTMSTRRKFMRGDKNINYGIYYIDEEPIFQIYKIACTRNGRLTMRRFVFLILGVKGWKRADSSIFLGVSSHGS